MQQVLCLGGVAASEDRLSPKNTTSGVHAHVCVYKCVRDTASRLAMVASAGCDILGCCLWGRW